MKIEADLGVFYTCFTEKEAVVNSLNVLYSVYPEIPVNLVSDGGADYEDLEILFPYLSTRKGHDSRGLVPKIPNTEEFLNDFWQEYIIKSIKTFLKRIKESIDFCQKPYILIMEPDVLVRGKLSIPEGAKLLGSKVNPKVLYQERINEYLLGFGGSVFGYGATPAIIESKTFLEIYHFLLENPNIIKDISKLDSTIANYDVLLPVIFALKGYEEIYNDEIVECLRNPHWESSGKPLVHQYRALYPKENYTGRHGNMFKL